MSEQNSESNTMLCKHRGGCIHAHFNECPFARPLASPVTLELDDPKRVCWLFEKEADK